MPDACVIHSAEPASYLNGALPLSVCMQDYIAKSGVARGKVVLDIGSGEGALLMRCLEMGASLALGVDHSPNANRQAELACAGEPARFALLSIADHAAVADFCSREAAKHNGSGLEDMVLLCNAAQMPLAEPLANGYFVGMDGRKTVERCAALGLCAEVVDGSLFTYELYPEVRQNPAVVAHLCQTRGLKDDCMVRGCLVRVVRPEPNNNL